MVRVVVWKKPILFTFLAHEKVLAVSQHSVLYRKQYTGSVKQKSETLEHSSVFVSPQPYRQSRPHVLTN